MSDIVFFTNTTITETQLYDEEQDECDQTIQKLKKTTENQSIEQQVSSQYCIF